MIRIYFLSKIRLQVLLISLFVLKFGLLAQDKKGHLSGDFYAISQYYLEDEVIGATKLPGGQSIGINTALSLNYTWNNFSAGIRYEAYEPPLLGFEPALEGHGFGYRFAQYKYKSLDVTVGNFYEQFGSGLTMRSYYEPQLGLDNSIDGARIKFSPKGLDLTLLYGKNRKYFEKDDSKIAGLNLDVYLADYLESLNQKNLSLDLGFSVVNKNETDETGLNVPASTLTWASRIDLGIKGFSFGVEYASKGEEPHSLNGFTENPGQGVFISAGYSQKGFGANIYWKFVDNMFFRSDRESLSNVTSAINYLPPNSNVNTYC